MTPIHDHICWCLVGVLQGVEREQRYSLREHRDGTWYLALVGEETFFVASGTFGPDSVWYGSCSSPIVSPKESMYRAALRESDERSRT